MITKARILLFLFATMLLVGCSETIKMPYETEMPIEIIRSPEGTVDFDSIFESAQRIITEKLPNAEYAVTFTKESCQNQKQKNGKITILFKDFHKRWFGFQEQVIFAWFVVDIESEKINLLITDESKNYASVDKYKKFSNDDFQKTRTTINEYLAEHKFDNCSIEITQMKDYWHVLVWSPSSSKYLAEFGIDQQNNVIKVADPITK